MRKNILAGLLLASLPALAQFTTVSDVLRYGNGSLASGTLRITSPQMLTVGLVQIVPATHTVNLTNGIVNVQLYPNDTSLPAGTSYRVEYVLLNGRRWVEIWVIPTGGPFTIAQVRVSTIPSTTPFVPLIQISPVSAAKGDLIVFGTGSWALLHAGANNQCLVVDTSQTLGLKWSSCGSGGGGGIVTLNGQTGPTVTLQVGSGGSDFNIAQAANVITLNIPTASATFRGLLSTTDWTRFDANLSTCPTCELLSNKDAASGYAGLTSSTKLKLSEGQEVWALSDLSDISGTTGSGTIAVLQISPTIDGTLTVGNGAGNDHFSLIPETSNPTCAAGNYFIWGNSTDLKLKKCENGSITDLDTSGGSPAFSAIASGTSNNLFVMGSGGSLSTSGSGVVDANRFKGNTVVALLDGGTAANLSATGGSGQVLRQSTTGAAVTVAKIAAGDLSDGVSGSGPVVLSTSASLTTPTLTLPVITNYSSATHDHQSAAGGGALAVAAITSGVFAKARQHAATVYSDQANTYTAGMVQILTPSASIAGIRLASLSGQPSSPVSGDLNNNAGALEFYTGAAWQRMPPASRSIATTSPLSGGGDLSADRTHSLAGLSNLGTANYIVGVNSGASAWEYKQLVQGANVTITHGANSVTIAASGSGSGHLIKDEGSSLTARANLNFIGGGITCADNAGTTTTDCSVPGGTAGSLPYRQTFSAQTSVTLTHSMASNAVIVQCFDAGSPPAALNWATLSLTDTNNATVTFSSAQSGECHVHNGAGGGAYAADFSAATTWTVTNATHQLASADLIAQVYSDDGTSYHALLPASIDINKSTFTVTITWGSNQAGHLVLLKSGGSGGSGGGGTPGLADPGSNGIVVRTATNVTTARTLAGTANEVAISNGSGVSGNPTFSIDAIFRIGGHTATQPNKTGALASIPATCTIGDTYFASDVTAGQNLYGCSATNTWTLEGDGGGGGGGASFPSQLRCDVVRTSATVLTILGGATASTPCILGGFTFTASATFTRSAGAETITARIYVDDVGTLTVGHNGTDGNYTCSGCVKTPAITSSPFTSVKVTRWNLTAGTWDATGTDERSWLQPGVLPVCGTGLNCADSGAKRTMSISASVATFGFTTTTFSTTPTFTATTSHQFFFITLTGNVSSSSLTGASAGGMITLKVCQDATGSRTFAFPTNFHGATTIGSTASRCNIQQFAFDGVDAWAAAAGQINVL